MIRHLFKLVWNRKRTNFLVMLEIFISFLVVFAVLTTGITLGSRWTDSVSAVGGLPGALGYDWTNVWNIRLELSHQESTEEADKKLLAEIRRLMVELQGMPEIEGVAGSMTPPYTQSTIASGWQVDGRRVRVTFDDVTDDFAKVMKTPVVRGRWFGPEDDAAPYRPVVLDEHAAAAIFPGKDPVGELFEEPGQTKGAQRIVGVVKSYRKDGELSPPDNMVFRRTSMVGAHGPAPWNLLIRVRPGTAAGALEERMVARLHEIAPTISFRVRKLDRMRRSVLSTGLTPVIAGGIIAAFLISMVGLGLTGIMWQDMTKRRREIGLRRATGASTRSIVLQVVGEAIVVATLAVVVASLIIAQLPLLGFFAGVTSRTYGMGFLAALAAIYGLTILCALYPSWLASRLQPAEALRYE